MRAVVYERFKGPVSVVDVASPKPGRGEVTIDVRATGICRSDWHGWQGHDPDIRALPHVPGHEMAGVIAEVGPEITGWEAGDRVTVPFVAGCGECSVCLAGDPQVCPNQSQPGFTHWGSFAERVTIKHAQHNLIRLPDQVGFVEAAVVGCRSTTAYRAVAQQGRVESGEWVAVYGCGGVGLSAVMIAAALGAKVVAVDTNPKALESATRHGATAVIEPGDELAAQVIEASDGGTHVGIDALGHPNLVRASMNALRRRGRHVQVGLLVGNASPTRIGLDRLIAHELEVIGSHGIAAAAIPEFFDFVLKNDLDLRSLVSREMSLNEGAERLEHFTENTEPGVAVIALSSDRALRT
jgi:alcohol dehydrogenase